VSRLSKNSSLRAAWLAPVALATAASLVWGGSVSSAAAAGSYTPQTGVMFNNPAGSFEERHVIRRHVDKTIASTRAGETIRVAQYAINFESTTRKLIKADERGVDVQVIVDDRHNYTEHRKLRRALGTDREASSFFYVCDSGCRAKRGGAQHSKFLTFTKAGGASNIVMVSSANLTGPGADWGWNDHYTFADKPKLHRSYVELFEEMKLDQRIPDPYRAVKAAGAVSHMVPQPGAALTDDPIRQALDSVSCKGATGGTGVNGRTLIEVSMFGWTGDRGFTLAEKLRKLDNRGCEVRVIVGKPAQKPLRELRRPGRNGGVEVHDSRYDRNGDGRPDKYVHTKYMLISGNVAGDSSSRLVYTGSQNWFDRSQTHDDEIVVSFGRRGVYNAYHRHFRNIWNNHSWVRVNKPLDAYDTTLRSYKPEPEFLAILEDE
jgi:hypothetical protein